MDALVPWILAHQELAPWIVFGLILLAGCNLPISIDILLVLVVVMATTVLPEKTYLLFFSFTLGCILSAWIAYAIGRFVGRRLLRLRFFKNVVTEARLEKMHKVYEKFGFFAFLAGRFIPFGVRNCLFLSSGISKISFKKFILFDGISCIIWSSLFFFSFLSLGQNYDLLLTRLKWINICIFAAFSMALIALICYKVKKRKQSSE